MNAPQKKVLLALCCVIGICSMTLMLFRNQSSVNIYNPVYQIQPKSARGRAVDRIVQKARQEIDTLLQKSTTFGYFYGSDFLPSTTQPSYYNRDGTERPIAFGNKTMETKNEIINYDSGEDSYPKGLDKRLLLGEHTVDHFPCPAEVGTKFFCQYYKPDWKDAKDLESVLSARIERVRERCLDYYPYMFNASLSQWGRNSSSTHRLSRTMFLMNYRLKLGFAWMPKMGSSFWKKAWGAVNQAKTKPGIPSPKRGNVGRQGLGKVFKEKDQRYKDYTIYTIARSPWERLVSVYREKCEKQRNHHCGLGFGYKACNTPQRNFEGWVNCVMNSFAHEKTEFYGHVDMTYQKSGVCDYPYDYIVVMENMAHEKEFMFKRAGVIDPLKAMDEVRNKTIRPVEVKNQSISYLDYWKNCTHDTIERVRFYYRYELYIYGYPETPFYIESST